MSAPARHLPAPERRGGAAAKHRSAAGHAHRRAAGAPRHPARRAQGAGRPDAQGRPAAGFAAVEPASCCRSAWPRCSPLMLGLVAFQARIAQDQLRLDRVESDLREAEARFGPAPPAGRPARVARPHRRRGRAARSGSGPVPTRSPTSRRRPGVAAEVLGRRRPRRPAAGPAGTGDASDWSNLKPLLSGSAVDRTHGDEAAGVGGSGRPPVRRRPKGSVFRAGRPRPTAPGSCSLLALLLVAAVVTRVGCSRRSTRPTTPPTASASAPARWRSRPSGGRSSTARATSWPCRCPQHTVWADPRLVDDPALAARKLGAVLGLWTEVI